MQLENKRFAGKTRSRFRHKTALAGATLILFFLACAVCCYWIAPDNSPNANLQCVEIQAQSPGFVQLFLKIPLQNNRDPSPSVWHIGISGKPLTNQWIPIQSFRVEQDSLVVMQRIDDNLVEKRSFSLTIWGSHPQGFDSNRWTEKRTYWLGTDGFGRDLLSRVLVGSRVSFAVGAVALLISLLLGIGVGLAAGYAGGKVDLVLQWLINVWWSIPTLLLAFAITLAMGKGFWQVFVAVGLTMWVNMARMVRGQVMVLKEMEYVQSARLMGLPAWKIATRHLLPNLSGPLLVMAAGNFASAILIEAGLSFLGLGIQAPAPSWGLMIKENYTFIITHHPLLAMIPGFTVILLVLAFNMLGTGLRDVVDVRSNTNRK